MACGDTSSVRSVPTIAMGVEDVSQINCGAGWPCCRFPVELIKQTFLCPSRNQATGPVVTTPLGGVQPLGGPAELQPQPSTGPKPPRCSLLPYILGLGGL